MTDDFQRKLQQLKQQYVNSLPGILKNITDDTKLLISFGVTTIDTSEFYRLVHSLTGSGATYGFSHISQCSREMESSIKELMSAKPERHNKIIGHILVLCNRLEEAVISAVNSDIEVEAVSTNDLFRIDPWKILVADDEKFSREQLTLLLEENGHIVYEAVDGQDALDQFMTKKPDLVIMDVVMPRMNGLESAKKIKAETVDHFVPIIFLTALEREDDLVECIRSGGDDFIVKPFDRGILLARIFSMQRIKKLQVELERYQRDTEEELSLARHVFDSATQRNNSGSQVIVKWIEACGHFSGDVLCYSKSPSNDLYIMLGDFTGHGLRAAIGALPASDIFYNKVSNSSSIEEICRDINQKLKLLLPTGQFLCACFMRISQENNQIEIIVAGLPPVVIKDNQGEIKLLESSNLPLGILDSNQMQINVKPLTIEGISDVYSMSDGIIEASNVDGEMYGAEKLLEILKSSDSIEDSIAELSNDFRKFLGDMEADDDISIIGVPFKT